jgi:tetratricopeptide (TPR) repeat protein
MSVEQGDRPARVFISYAHDSDDHREAVREFWVLLRQCGIDARLDRTAAEQPRDWTLWMLEQMREAKFVLCVASPAYRRRSEGTEEPGKGLGVQWEAALIREEFLRDRDQARRHLLPVLLPSGSVTDIPAFFGPFSGTNYQIAELSRAGIEPLRRVLIGQASEVEPPLRSPLHNELVLDVRLDGEGLIARTLLQGTVLGERSGPLPSGIEATWEALEGAPAVAEERLAEAGHRLRHSLFDQATTRHLSDLVNRSTPGTVLEVVVEADGPAQLLPYELLRLPDTRALATLPGVRIRRRLPDITHAATPPSAGPLKILVAVGAPDETRTRSRPFDVEAAQQAILDAIGDLAERGEAQMTILEVGHPAQIAEALHRDRYHVVHISAHGSPEGVELEDEEGAPVWVTADELMKALRESRSPLPLVVLSSCAGGGGGTVGMAATLVTSGADRVLAMQGSVTDRYATALARRFYEELAADARTHAAEALAVARRRVEDERLEANRRGELPVSPEYGLPVLLCAGDDPPLRDPAAPARPLRQPDEFPSGGSVRELAIGQLIGRRPELRTALAALRGGQAAVDRWGALSGVTLTGIGGIGKTAVAGRMMARLRGEGWLVAVHPGRWDPLALFTAIASAVEGRPGLERVRETLSAPAVEDTRKLGLVTDLLKRERLLLVLDDFEQNLEIGGERFLDAGFAEIFTTLCAAVDRGRLLVTSRYPVPGEGAVTLLEVPLLPLTQSELGRLFLRMPALRELSTENRRTVARAIGGHPRLIEFVDALLRGGRANLREVARKLRDLADRRDVTLWAGRPVGAAVDEAVLLGTRDVLLDELWGLLGADEREVVLQAAVSRAPYTVADLAKARWAADPTEERATTTSAITDRLLDLTLLTPSGPGEFTMHAWVGEALGRYQGDGLVERHNRAAQMRWGRIRAGAGTFADLIDMARHLAAAGRFDEFERFALAACDALRGVLSVTAFLGEVIPLVPAGTWHYLRLADRESQALLAAGSTAAARERVSAMLEVTTIRAEADPGNAVAQRDLSLSQEKLGDLMVRVGNGVEAERLYRQSLAIRERLAGADPGNAVVQRDISGSLNRLADLIGNRAEAERLYRQSLAIRERLAEADPGSAEAQRDLSVVQERLGVLMVRVGNGAEAERLYRQSLAIRERLAKADPESAHAQRDLSVSLNQLGELMVRVGNGAEAERLYRQSLGIAERLAKADPGSADARRDLSISQEKLGDVTVLAGNGAEAERRYRQSLANRERLAEADPGSADAHRDLVVILDKLGGLMVRVGNGGKAERLYRQSLAIRVRLAEADPGSADAQRNLNASLNRLGDLMVRMGKGVDAERLYRQSLGIAERLAEVEPGSAQAQRDLGCALDRLGDLMVEMGNGAEAERLYRQSLGIAGRLAEADPGSARAQRDLSVSLGSLGDLMVEMGNGAEAERLYRQSLGIAERLAEADPGSAEAQRDLCVSRDRLGDLMVRVGNQAEAERLYRQNLDIHKRLAEVDPGGTRAQRDLSYACTVLGDLERQTGHTAEAERLYRDALTIDRRLADLDPSNVTAQEDLSVPYRRLGDLLTDMGNATEAAALYREHLAWVERRLGPHHPAGEPIRAKLRALGR